MTNIFDYLRWRGDLSFESVPFGDVDSLIMCRLAYIPFAGFVPGEFKSPAVPLGAAARAVLNAGVPLRIRDDAELLRSVISSPRFSSLRLSGFTDIWDDEKQEQFAAVTFLVPDGSIIVSFRGTDGTLVGWKEDFNMGFSEVVPAQADAAAYLNKAADAFPRVPICVVGHSKGGNLAVYASAFCPTSVQERILAVRNNDGPGFSEKAVASAGFQRILDRVRTYLPQSSVVGMLLEHTEDFFIVHSTTVGVAQHNIYSWEVMGGSLVSVGSLTNSSQFVDSTLKDWVSAMTPEQREKIIDSVYSVLKASGGTALRDLLTGSSSIALLRAAGDMDDETRRDISECLRMLRSSLKKSLPVLAARLSGA